MTFLLAIWIFVSAAFGLVHAIYNYRWVVVESPIVATEHTVAVQLQACYVALWTFGLLRRPVEPKVDSCHWV